MIRGRLDSRLPREEPQSGSSRGNRLWDWDSPSDRTVMGLCAGASRVERWVRGERSELSSTGWRAGLSAVGSGLAGRTELLAVVVVLAPVVVVREIHTSDTVGIRGIIRARDEAATAVKVAAHSRHGHGQAPFGRYPGLVTRWADRAEHHTNRRHSEPQPPGSRPRGHGMASRGAGPEGPEGRGERGRPGSQPVLIPALSAARHSRMPTGRPASAPGRAARKSVGILWLPFWPLSPGPLR